MRNALVIPPKSPCTFIPANLLLVVLLTAACSALAQVRPYIGYVYPAGGELGTTFEIKLGGQGLEDVDEVLVTGAGVTVRLKQYHRALNPQETQLLNEQMRELRRTAMDASETRRTDDILMTDSAMSEDGNSPGKTRDTASGSELMARIQKRLANHVARPASVALAHIIYAAVTIAPGAEPGPRELRVVTGHGISNPLVFDIGQLPEVTRKPMITAPLQVLGKEEQALRSRPKEEIERCITLPCTLNGQIASGELNRYRFKASKGQNLVITTRARKLIPFIADAVPGWFQPVIVLHDARGKEVAYADDYRFHPDPTILFKVSENGEYTLSIYDAIYRGREDFVYRIQIGQLPFITSIFPLGAPLGAVPEVSVEGWNLGAAELNLPKKTDANPGVYTVRAKASNEWFSNPVHFALDDLPEVTEREANDTREEAQEVNLPVIINGRADKPADWDVFKFSGKSNEVIVAEVCARRLDSPLDSILRVSDAAGTTLALGDDCEDPGDGISTHHADSWISVTLPSDGTYFVHIADTAGNGGKDYAYRLRVSTPRPHFELRAVPSSLAVRGRSGTPVSVHAIRKDGFSGPIHLELKNPPAGFSASPVTISEIQTVARLTVRAMRASLDSPVSLEIAGSARIKGTDVTRVAIPAEDRMQAFLWRHLVPASELIAMVYNPSPRPGQALRRILASASKPADSPAATNALPSRPKFTRQQVAGRLRQLNLLFSEGLLSKEFFDRKVAECEAAL